MVRPLPEREHAEEPRGGRRKKKKVGIMKACVLSY